MNFNFNDADIKNLTEIGDFLFEHGIQYSTEYDNFSFPYGNGSGRLFEIEYVPTGAVYLNAPKYGVTDGVDVDYFFKMSKHAEENNSFKFWIKQFEWENPVKREVLKSQILHAAGKTPTKIPARYTEVKVFSNKEIRAFEEQNCFYGYRSASLNLGLVMKRDYQHLKKGDLVMVYTFGKNFFGKKEGIVEIFRVGTLNYCVVTGGTTKLCKHFIEKYPVMEIANKPVAYDKIVYYVDYDHGIGSSVDHLGFSLVRYSGGGFMNYDVLNNQVSHRAPMQHKQIMERIAKGEIISIPNAGVKVYELDCSTK